MQDLPSEGANEVAFGIGAIVCVLHKRFQSGGRTLTGPAASLTP